MWVSLNLFYVFNVVIYVLLIVIQMHVPIVTYRTYSVVVVYYSSIYYTRIVYSYEAQMEYS